MDRRGQEAGMSARTPAGGRPARHAPVWDSAASNDIPIPRATDREVRVVAAVLLRRSIGYVCPACGRLSADSGVPCSWG